MFWAVLSYHSTQLLVSVIIIITSGMPRVESQRAKEGRGGGRSEIRPPEWDINRNFGAKCGLLCPGLFPQALRADTVGAVGSQYEALAEAEGHWRVQCPGSTQHHLSPAPRILGL